MKKVAILVFDQVFDSAFSITYDILRTGTFLAKRNEGSSPFEIELLSVEEREITTGSGQRLLANRTIKEASPVDLIVLPGLELFDGPSIQTYVSDKLTQGAIKWLYKQYQLGSSLAAGCTSTFILAETTILDHRLATTSWWLAQDFQEYYPKVRLSFDNMVIHEEKLFCSGAAMAHIDLALALLEQVAGPNLSSEVAKILLLDGRDSQAGFGPSLFLSNSNEETFKAEIWIRRNLQRSLTISEIADGVGLAPKTLSRRIQEATGMSCNKFTQHIRVDRAIQLLKTTNLNFELISHKVGYADPASLRKLIRRNTGKNPTEHRS